MGQYSIPGSSFSSFGAKEYGKRYLAEMSGVGGDGCLEVCQELAQRYFRVCNITDFPDVRPGCPDAKTILDCPDLRDFMVANYGTLSQRPAQLYLKELQVPGLMWSTHEYYERYVWPFQRPDENDVISFADSGAYNVVQYIGLVDKNYADRNVGIRRSPVGVLLGGTVWRVSPSNARGMAEFLDHWSNLPRKRKFGRRSGPFV